MYQPVSALGKRLHVEWVDFYGDLTMHACIADNTGLRTQVCIDGARPVEPVTAFFSKLGIRINRGQFWSS